MTKVSTNLGKVATTPKGEYNSATTYLRLDVVLYNGSSYVCLKESVGNLPTNTEYWQLMASKGDKGDKPIKGVDYFTQEDIASLNIPEYTSDLVNDSSFIDNTVNNLINYYLKNETYTKAEVNTLIGNIQQFHYEVVQTLPQTGETNILYLVPKSTSQTNNYYDEYVYSNGWEKIGDTQVDLSNYYTKTETNALIDEMGIETVDLSSYNFTLNQQIPSGTPEYETIMALKNRNVKSRVLIVKHNYNTYILLNSNPYQDNNVSFISIIANKTINGYIFPQVYIQGNIMTFSTYNTKLLYNDNNAYYEVSSAYQPTHKQYVDSKLADKQDTLTAGTNITIDANNVISASGGTQEVYSIQSTNSANDPFVIDGKKRGVYFFNNSYSNNIFYYKIYESDTSALSINNMQMLYIEIYKDVDYANLSNNETFGRTVFVSPNNNSIMRGFIKKTTPYPISASGANVFQILTNNNQAISGVKTFYAIPQQSTTTAPTQNTEFTNKKYVDDQISNAVGNINTILATLTTPSGNGGN